MALPVLRGLMLREKMVLYGKPDCYTKAVPVGKQQRLCPQQAYTPEGRTGCFRMKMALAFQQVAVYYKMGLPLVLAYMPVAVYMY